MWNPCGMMWDPCGKLWNPPGMWGQGKLLHFNLVKLRHYSCFHSVTESQFFSLNIIKCSAEMLVLLPFWPRIHRSSSWPVDSISLATSENGFRTCDRKYGVVHNPKAFTECSPGRRRKLDATDIQFIKSLLHQNPCIYLNKLKNELLSRRDLCQHCFVLFDAFTSLGNTYQPKHWNGMTLTGPNT